MSRLGKKPVEIPAGVKVAFDNNTVSVEGPLGKLQYEVPKPITIEIKNEQLIVKRPTDLKKHMSLHGLVRTFINNMIIGVTKGYKKELEIRGVGYKAKTDGSALNMSLGYSHPVEYAIPEEVTIETPKPTVIIVKGPDKVKVGEVAAEIRDFCKPEVYKGKGVRYKDEYVRHKAGKTVA